jgi:hypothetical protein
MSGQLWNAFNNIKSIINLVIVPYGNAKETWRNETKLWQFTCQVYIITIVLKYDC